MDFKDRRIRPALAVLALGAALMSGSSALAAVDLGGYYNPVMHEDQPERIQPLRDQLGRRARPERLGLKVTREHKDHKAFKVFKGFKD